MPSDETATSWKLAAAAAVAIAVLSLYPQLKLVASRGKSWHGGLAYSDTDEIAYAAYVSALINGKPRLNDPYTGAQADPSGAQPESLFSIQFIPAYLVALPARLLGVSATVAFQLLMPISSCASALALFYLLFQVTGDSRLSAAGVIVVLCLATLISLEGPIAAARNQPGWGYLPFLRRYIPAVPFPCFILLLATTWQSLLARTRRGSVLMAGVSGILFAVLVFSYFYLWTSALVWLACLLALWFITRPTDRTRVAMVAGVTGCLAVAALIPYAFLLSRRDARIDSVQALIKSHAPDLLRPSEIIGSIIILLLLYAVLQSPNLMRRADVMVAASLALTPFIVFNQQLLTGRSLQPFHYEEFVTGYLVLIAFIITLSIHFDKWKDGHRFVWGRLLFWAAVLSLCWGAFEASGTSRGYQYLNDLNDDTMPVAKRLAEIALGEPNPIIFSTNLFQSDTLPVITSLPVLWAPHMRSYSGSTAPEERERFFQHLYYMGIDVPTLAASIKAKDLYVTYALFGWERVNPVLVAHHSEILPDEERAALREYGDYLIAFNETAVVRHRLSYLVIPAENPPALANLDRWYIRETCLPFNKFVLCHLKKRDIDNVSTTLPNPEP